MPAACLIVRVFAVAVAGQPLDCSALFFFFAFVFVLGAGSVLGRRAAESARWQVYASCFLLLVDTGYYHSLQLVTEEGTFVSAGNVASAQSAPLERFIGPTGSECRSPFSSFSLSTNRLRLVRRNMICASLYIGC